MNHINLMPRSHLAIGDNSTHRFWCYRPPATSMRVCYKTSEMACTPLCTVNPFSTCGESADWLVILRHYGHDLCWRRLSSAMWQPITIRLAFHQPERPSGEWVLVVSLPMNNRFLECTCRVIVAAEISLRSRQTIYIRMPNIWRDE